MIRALILSMIFHCFIIFFKFHSFFYFQIRQIRQMIIEKIEKLAELSFNNYNQAESRAALQSCFYNLKNLQKIVENSQGDKQRIVNSKILKHSSNNHRNSQCNSQLPDISIINAKNKFTTSSSNFTQTTRDYKRTKYVDENQINPIRNKFVTYNEKSYKGIKLNENNKDQTFVTHSSSLLKSKDNSKLSFTKSLNSGIQNEKMKQKNGKRRNNFQFRSRKVPKTILGLAKNQIFFQQKQVVISQQIVNKIGLYEAGNLYKENNIRKFLRNGYQNNFNPIINLKFATFGLCNRNQFFLTNNAHMSQLNEADSYMDFLKQDQQKQKQEEEKVIQKQDEEYKTKQLKNIKKYRDNVVQSTQKQQSIQQSKVQVNSRIYYILTIQNYVIVKNQQYFSFKKSNIEDWSQINFILQKISQYLKKVKISLLSFKFEKDIFMKELWSCRKVEDKLLEKLLKIKLKIRDQSEKTQEIKTIRLFSSKAQIIRQLVKIWRDRKNLQIKKKNKQNQKQLLIWMGLRMMAKRRMKISKQRVVNRVKVINQKLRNGDWDYEVEIHIPSFSESQFVRGTTQYMEYYENMFYHIWKSSNKQFVLIIPAINQVILKLFQQKIKLNKNITLICPQSHQLYPKSLPLSACLLYSKDGLCRVKKILDGKKGIIIPGRRSNESYLYQEYLSDYLNCPLFSTFNAPSLIGDIKGLWEKYQVSTTLYTKIQPHSDLNTVIEKLSQLISQHPKTKVWVLKMNGEFNGRGIATFDTQSSKKLKQILNLQEQNLQISQDPHHRTSKLLKRIKNETKLLISQYLKTYFRLKLKINFQNCIFRVEEYIQKFLQKGGIIEQFIEECQTYQFCFKLQPGYSNYSHLYILQQLEQQKYISCCQNFEVNFVTKSAMFAHDRIPRAVKQFSKKAQKILKSERYLGYVSVTVLYCPKKQQYFAVEIKPYMTINSSISYFLKVFSTKRGKQGINRRNGNVLNRNQNLHSHTEIVTQRDLMNNGLIYLFIPVIVFTDVDEGLRSQIIQNLVTQSWDKTSNRLFNHSIVAENPDTFHGSFYLSMGLSLGLLLYGKSFDLKKMKNEAVDMMRQLSQKIQSIKLYRGKQETRDVFQFGDLIRAITKVRS